MADDYNKLLGSRGVIRSLLFQLLSETPEEQLSVLSDQVSGTLADLTELWGESLSAHEDLYVVYKAEPKRTDFRSSTKRYA